MVKRGRILSGRLHLSCLPLACYLYFSLYPVFEAVKLSFYKWDWGRSAKPIFIGLENYKQLFSRQISGCRCRNALFFMIGGFLILMPLAFFRGNYYIKYPWS